MDVYQTEEQQVEAIKGFWKENGNSVIAGLVIGFSGFIGFNYYKDHQLTQEMNTADAFQTVMESASNDKAAFTQAADKFISENGSTSYASLTALALAKEAATQKEWAEVEKHLSVAIEKSQAEGIKAIATIRLARVQIQLEKYDAALTSLSSALPLSFTGMVEETKGDVYLKQGKKELARTSYQAALAANAQSNNTGLQMKIDDLAETITLAN